MFKLICYQLVVLRITLSFGLVVSSKRYNAAPSPCDAIPRVRNRRIRNILTTNLAACVCVCVRAQHFYQFLQLRSYFVSKRPENFVRIAKFPYAAFGPLFAFHCPLFFTRNNDLGCKSSRSAVVVSPVCGR